MSVQLRKIFALYIVFLILQLKLKSEAICNMTNVIENHKKTFDFLPVSAKYVPNKSCFICLTPSCDFKNPKCEKSFEFKDLPYYNRVFEFGLFGSDLPDHGYIKIPINKKCYAKANIAIIPTNFTRDALNHSGYNLEINLQQCKFFKNICDVNDTIEEKYLQFNISCIFVGIIMKERKQFHISVSQDCLTVSTALRKNIHPIIIDDPVCYYSEEFPTPNVSMKFYHSERQPHEAVTIILPCSPGGYAVNPISGRFVSDMYCRSIYYTKCEGSTIEELIQEMFNSSQNLLFPRMRISHKNKTDNFRPIFIDKYGKAKSEASMSPKFKPDKYKYITGRHDCSIYVQNGSQDIVFSPDAWTEDYEPLDAIGSIFDLYSKSISKRPKRYVTPRAETEIDREIKYPNGNCLGKFPDLRIIQLALLIYFYLLQNYFYFYD